MRGWRKKRAIGIGEKLRKEVKEETKDEARWGFWRGRCWGEVDEERSIRVQKVGKLLEVYWSLLLDLD